MNSVDEVSGAVVRPVGYKKRHKAQWLWQRWLAIVEFIDKCWPRNP